MNEVTFRFAADGSVFTDDPVLVQPLARVLGEVLRLDRIPASLALVGHCPVVGRWCVFAREQGEPDVRGVVLPEGAYAEVGFDPFVAAAAHLRGASLVAAVQRGPAEPATFPHEADGLADPLRTAYGCFLAGDPALRQGPYVSTLPAGLAPEISPLTCLVVPRNRPAVIPAEEVFQSEEHTGHPTSSDGSPWHSVDLERGGDTMSPRPPTPESPVPAAAGDLERRLGALERRLARTRWMTAVGLLVTLVVGVAGGVLLASRLDRLDASTVKTATLAHGLGLEAGASSKPEAIEAHLHDLATVAVQSGAWQSGLRRRGVQPAHFLDQLVDMTQAHDSLLGLAADAAPLRQLAARAGSLSDLAPRSANLLTLASQEEALTDLASRQDALASLADHHDALDSLAGSAKTLSGLAASAQDLGALAGSRAALTALAGERPALESLASRATPLRTLADQGAGLMVFWERYHHPLAALAERQQSLEALVQRQRTLERLVESSPELLSLAQSDPLLRLVQRPDAFRALADDLDDVLAIADHRRELIGGAAGDQGRPPAPSPRSSG